MNYVIIIISNTLSYKMLVKTWFFAKLTDISNHRSVTHTHTFTCNPGQCGLHIPPSQSIGAGFPSTKSPVEMWVLQLSMYACHCPCPAKGNAILGSCAPMLLLHSGHCWVKAAPQSNWEVLGLAQAGIQVPQGDTWECPSRVTAPNPTSRLLSHL